MTLQTAAQQALSTLESGALLCEVTAASMLRVALADEQAQAVESVSCGYDETTGNCTSNQCCYTPAVTGERAELIDAILISLTEYTHEGYVRDILSRAANMLAADANKAQQVAVPEGWALVPIEPTGEMLVATNAHPGAWTALVLQYQAMLAAAPKPPKGDNP